jgi:hypothetical protein
MADDTLERAISGDDFAKPESVLLLAREAYSGAEAVKAIGCKAAAFNDVVSRVHMPLVGRVGRGRAPTQYHLIDLYSIAIFLKFDRIMGTKCRPALSRELHSLMWGDAASLAEHRVRSAEDAIARGRPGSKQRQKHIDHMHRITEQRRLELHRDIFAANVIVWSRDPDRHFCVLARKDVRLFPLLVDRGQNGGRIDPEIFFRHGFLSLMNVTQSLMQFDEQLAEIVEARGGAPELAEAN